MMTIILLYAAEGLPAGIFHDLVAVWLLEAHDISLGSLVLVSLLVLFSVLLLFMAVVFLLMVVLLVLWWWCCCWWRCGCYCCWCWRWC